MPGTETELIGGEPSRRPLALLLLSFPGSPSARTIARWRRAGMRAAARANLHVGHEMVEMGTAGRKLQDRPAHLVLTAFLADHPQFRHIVLSQLEQTPQSIADLVAIQEFAGIGVEVVVAPAAQHPGMGKARLANDIRGEAVA